MSDELALNETKDDPAVPPDVATAEQPAAPARRSRAAAWRSEAVGIFWLVLAVLGFHSLVAKPFYIPSESMLPGLLVGDQLVVSKFPYGWSFVSPTFHVLPFIRGRLFGGLPERGDIVIASPPGSREDYIKRVIGLPGDRLEVRDGVVVLNGVPVKRGPLHDFDIPDYGGVAMGDGTRTCDPGQYPGALYRARDGRMHCRLPLVTETLPNGRTYDTVELGWSTGDNFGPITVPPDSVFLMGDNRDRSADSRFPVSELGLGGAVRWENLGGRAEFLTFSNDGSGTWDPRTWPGALRGGRSGLTLHAKRKAVR
ncbi:signal peptidase I [uncultured Sphingomonas sp.]|uniref:signal peptidase I n=1 Tax=uncultured Sphingomonas sp. TaxID=158754 RepID=UPI0035CAE83E